MNPNAAFWNRMAKRYAATRVPDEASYQEKLARTRAVLAPDAKVLEIGCGTGSTALTHAPHVGHILATDYASNMIAIAETKAAAAKVTNVSFRTATLDDIPAEDGPFDAILALNLVHLLPDPEAALGRMMPLLRPGGVLVLSTPCLADRMGWLRPIAFALHAVRVIPPVGFLRQSDLERWLSDLGMEIEDTWRPKGAAKATFHIARKPDSTTAPVSPPFPAG